MSVSPDPWDHESGPKGLDLWPLGPGVNSPLSVERNAFLSTASPLPAGAEAGSRLLGRLLGGDEMDKATGERAHQTKTPWGGV